MLILKLNAMNPRNSEARVQTTLQGIKIMLCACLEMSYIGLKEVIQ